MKKIIKNLAKKVPFFSYIVNKNIKLNKKIQKQGAFPAGHYYSPIPAAEDVCAYIQAKNSLKNEPLGVGLNKKKQYELLEEYIELYKDVPFLEKQTPEYRYYYDNEWFSYSDAIFLYCFLRKYKPSKIIEVGSGFSSAVILDTVDSCFTNRPEITFIEPFPDRLISLLNGDDQKQVEIIQNKVQDTSKDYLLSLEAGDLLFIDSSHVVKCGSDLQFLLFEIIPQLKPGVFVHFHDVFYPFDYPSDWLNEGRYWNENYFLHAFLMHNHAWSIKFFNTYVHLEFGELIQEKMPLCSKNTGGSLYIQRN
jgi:hypothetical protein